MEVTVTKPNRLEDTEVREASSADLVTEANREDTYAREEKFEK